MRVSNDFESTAGLHSELRHRTVADSGQIMTDLVGHFLLFTVLGVVFLLLPLVIGLFVRPTNPTPQKLAAYECGEPTIGSSYVQFDLRFYVVALLFIIFDVEVAFFFPVGGGLRRSDAVARRPRCRTRRGCSSAKSC